MLYVVEVFMSILKFFSACTITWTKIVSCFNLHVWLPRENHHLFLCVLAFCICVGELTVNSVVPFSIGVPFCFSFLSILYIKYIKVIILSYMLHTVSQFA